MPRAFCPECAAEVPVDEEGHCFLGHEVPAGAGGSTSSRPEISEPAEEPEPWVATVSGEGAKAPADDGVAEPTAAAGKAVPAEEATPDDAGTARPTEIPSDEDEVDLDLDTLERAVAELGLTAEDDEALDEDAFAVFDEEQPEIEQRDVTRPPTAEPEAVEPDTTAEAEPPATETPQRDLDEGDLELGELEEPSEEPEVEVHEDAVADVLGVQGVDTEPAPEPGPEPEPVEDADPDEEADEEAEEEPDEEPEPIDTANFLARPKGKRRGPFGR